MPTLDDLGRGRTAVFAHRGSSVLARENTVEALSLAARQGAAGVELDVRTTSDNVLVVHHDASVAGVGDIVASPFAHLRAQAPWVPTLDEAVAACEAMVVNAEIKNNPAEPDFDSTDGVADALVEWCHENQMGNRLLVSSFNPSTVNRVRALDESIATGQLLPPSADPHQAIDQAKAAGLRAIHPFHETLTEAETVMEHATRAEVWVVAWTVDDPNEIRQLASAGITVVITNDPAKALEALG